MMNDMKNFLKRMSYFLLVMVLLVSLAGCQSQPSQSSNSKPGSENVGSGASGSEPSDSVGSSPKDSQIDTSERVDIVWYRLGDNNTNGQLEAVQEKWNEILLEKVNATCTIKFIEWTDWEAQYDLKLASGEAFDLISIGTDWLRTWQNAQRGAFMDITDLLPIYAPITFNEDVSSDEWEQCKFNGQIIMIPENQFTQWINNGFVYRGDYLQEFGMDDIKSWDDIAAYLQKAKDAYPEQFPMDIGANADRAKIFFNGYYASATDSFPYDPVSDIMFYAKDIDNLTQIEVPFDSDLFEEFAELTDKWAKAGYWREDVLNYTGDDQDNFREGNTAAVLRHNQWFVGNYGECEKKVPGMDPRFFTFQEVGKKNLVRMTITHGGASVPISSKNPERALMVYDLFRNDEELYRLMNYGIEGVQYEIDSDGFFTQPEGYDDVNDSLALNYWDGRMDKFMIPSRLDYPQEKKEKMYQEYDSYALDYPFAGFVWDASKVESQLTNCNNVINSQLPTISFGKTNDPKAAVEQFRADLKAAGIDDIKAELQTQLEAWLNSK